MRFEHFVSNKGQTVYVNPDQVCLVEADGDMSVITTINGSTTVKGTVDQIMAQLEGEVSHFPVSVRKLHSL